MDPKRLRYNQVFPSSDSGPSFWKGKTPRAWALSLHKFYERRLNALCWLIAMKTLQMLENESGRQVQESKRR